MNICLFLYIHDVWLTYIDATDWVGHLPRKYKCRMEEEIMAAKLKVNGWIGNQVYILF